MRNACRWCGRPFTDAEIKRAKVWCSNAHRERFKRAERAATIADLIEQLGPHVDEAGIFVYKELVDHLTARLQSGV